MTMHRKDFLLGMGGALAGAASVVAGRWLGEEEDRAADPARAPEPPVPSIQSYAQSGEDIVAGFIFDYLEIPDVTYLDVGAYDPILLNNTYYFYTRGHRGVLVEPNVTICEKLREVRPEDTTLVAGIGVPKASEADYYVMSEPSWSTFSREEAEHQVEITNGRITIEEVRKMPLLDINEVMDEHFGGGAPAFLSIDAEGLHQAILEAVDYERFRPQVICVETLVSGSTRTLPEIANFMDSRGYVDRGGSFVNTIFVDSRIL